MSDFFTIDEAAAATSAAVVWNTPYEAANLLWSDPTVHGTNPLLVRDAVTFDSWTLHLASDAQKDDDVILTAACKQDANWALKFASRRLQNNKELVLVAVQRCGSALEYASETLRNTKEVVLIAVEENGDALQYASERLRNTKEVVLIAVEQNGYALMFASDELKNCIDVACAAVNGANNYDGRVENYAWRCQLILNHAGTEIKEKIRAFEDMVSKESGILQSLDKTDPLALSKHLELKFGLRRVFLQPLLCSGISSPQRSLDDSECTIPHSVIKDICGYAGVPLVAELRQLRLVREILPVVTAFASRSGTSWAALKLDWRLHRRVV